MSDRGPSGQDPDPTEFFPPLPPEPRPTAPIDLPPIGSERDPEPTRVMPPAAPPPPTASQYPPTTAVPPTGGGPYDPGPPYGGGGSGGGGAGGPGGPGGPYEPELNPEPDPWYRQPGPLAALIAGIAAVVVAVIALLVWTSDGDENSDDTLPTVVTTTLAPTTVASTLPPTTTTSTLPPTTTSTTSTTTTTTTTTTLPPTTTTLPPTTTQPPTTPAPTTTTPPPPPTTVPLPVVTIPDGETVWAGIEGNDSISTFRDALECTGLAADLQEDTQYTVFAIPDAAFVGPLANPCDNPGAVEPILQLHLVVGNDFTAEQIFGTDEVATLAGPLSVDGAAQTLGTNGTTILVRNVRGSDGFIQVVDRVIQD